MRGVAAILLAISGAVFLPSATAQARTAVGNSAAEEVYPAAAILANFSKTCADLSSISAAEAAAHAAGWEVYEPEKESPVAKLMAFGMSAAASLAEEDKDYKTEARIMRTTIGGRNLDLMLTGVQSFGTYSLGCRMVDFAATVPIDDQTIDTWARSIAPDAAKVQRSSMAGVLTASIWRPGLFANHEKTQVAFVPQSSEMKSAFHLSGNNLMTQTRN